MKLLLEYQQNPTFRTANERLKLAEEEAIRVCNNERVRYFRVKAWGGGGGGGGGSLVGIFSRDAQSLPSPLNFVASESTVLITNSCYLFCCCCSAGARSRS